MTIIDRYIIKQFIQTLVYSILALYFIFIIVTLMENLDEFLDQGVDTIIIIKYYLYYFPEITKLMTPVSMLLATLFSVGRLASLNEVTAMKTGGQSLYRLMLPILLFGMALSFWQLYFNGWVVPPSIERKNEIERVYLKKKKTTNSIYNLYFRDTPTRNLSINYYNSDGKYGRNFAIEEFTNDDKPRLISRIEAANVKWDEDNNDWLLLNVLQKNFNDTLYSKSLDSLHLSLKIDHSQLVKLKKELEEMDFTELKQYIDLLEQGGKDVSKQLIEYNAELAFPFANFIIVLFGVPFASIKKKGGMAVQIAAALVVSFCYLIFTEISKTIALANNLDPLISGWLANLVFLVFSLIIVLRTKT
ncbi:LptF/LptG family permease [Candidatus Kapabacteria bacterium]|nr:LptF/LptG family permease [Candidatus Kapabacteria bacterium]